MKNLSDDTMLLWKGDRDFGKVILEREEKILVFTVNYKLYESEAQHGKRKIYSICAEKISEDECEKSVIYDISRMKKKAVKIFEVISSSEVTPCTLKDVIENIL